MNSMSRICGRSIVGWYTSLRMPCEHVNHTRLEPEYAVPTASLVLDVHRGARPGAPNASPCCFNHRYWSLIVCCYSKREDCEKCTRFCSNQQDESAAR